MNDKTFSKDDLAQIGAYLVNHFTTTTTDSQKISTNEAYEQVVPTLQTAFKAATRDTGTPLSINPTELMTMIKEYQPRLTNSNQLDIARNISRFSTSCRFENVAEAQAWNTILGAALSETLNRVSTSS